MYVLHVLGGTSVSCAVMCPPNEKRMIIALDTSQMVSERFRIQYLEM